MAEVDHSGTPRPVRGPEPRVDGMPGNAEVAVASRVDLTTRIGSLVLANPVMPASGCFGPELAALIPLHRLGALVTKTLFSSTRSGNPAHRITDSGFGALNSVGIPSPGFQRFRDDVLPAYDAHGVPVIVSIGGLTRDEYWQITEQVAELTVAALEVNASCPNLEHGGLAIGVDPQQVYELVVGVVARAAGLPVIVKLTPNVGSISEIAVASQDAGAAALTVANTFVGLAIDLDRRRPVLGAGTGGYSGPGIKPLALRLVWEAARVVSIPVIGCGGIVSTTDVAEFLMAGASAVQVGTATFSQPATMVQIIDELPAQLARLGLTSASALVGSLST